MNLCVLYFFCEEETKKKESERAGERERHKVVHTQIQSNARCMAVIRIRLWEDLYYHGINEPISGIQALLKYRRCFYLTNPHCTFVIFYTHTHTCIDTRK